MYGLEGQLTELEDAARCIHSGTQDTELAELEDQVASAAAQVHHAELQVRAGPAIRHPHVLPSILSDSFQDIPASPENPVQFPPRHVTCHTLRPFLWP